MRRETYEVSRRSALPFYLRVPIRLERIQMELNKVKNLVEEAEMSLGIIICVDYMGQCNKKKRKETCKGSLDINMQVLCRFLAEGHTVHGQGKLCAAQKSVAAVRLRGEWRSGISVGMGG